MNNEPANSAAHAAKLTTEIKKAFPKLSDADIALRTSSPDKFYEAVQTKQGNSRDEAEKTVKKLDAECAAACGKSSDTDSRPGAKAANA